MRKFLSFGRYASVAVFSAGSDWVVFSALVSLLDQPHLASLMIARIVGGLVSFFCNRHWTWSERRHLAVTQQGRRFLILYMVSYTISVGLFSLLSGVLGLPPYPAKLLTDISCFVLNFLVMQVYVYHQRIGFLGRLRSLVTKGTGDAP